MSLENGRYIIKSLSGDLFIGRSPSEPPIRHPKQVFALPEGTQGSQIVLEKNDKGYKIKIGGAPTGVYNDAVFAFLDSIEQPQPEDWVITSRPQHGENIFTVETQNSGKGWVRARDAGLDGYPFDNTALRGSQIDIDTLIVTPTPIPRFTAPALYVFTLIEPY